MEQSFTLSPPTSAEALSRVRAHVALLRASEAPHQRSHAEDLEALVKLAESDTEADLRLQIKNLHANVDDLLRQRDEALNKVREFEHVVQGLQAAQQPLEQIGSRAPTDPPNEGVASTQAQQQQQLGQQPA